MLSVILLALLMILLSTLYLIGPQICGNSLSEFLTLNLILKALRIGCLKVEIIVILWDKKVLFIFNIHFYLEHDRFKQNLQILSNKSIQQPNNSSGVYSVLSANNSHSQDSQRSSYPDHDQQNIYHPPSMFGGGRRHQNENIPTDSLRMDENAHGSSINYASLHAANHNSSNSNWQGTYNSASNRNATPPQIFSASINGANLMQNPDHNQISDNQSQRKTHDHNIHPGSQNYSHGLGLGSSIHIGLSSNAPTSQQQPYSQANSSNMQYSQQGSYVQESNYSQSSSSGLQYVQTTTAYQVKLDLFF